MKKILLTGSTGFIGRNILPLLRRNYDVKAPRRTELNIKDSDALGEYLKMNEFDIVIHTAIPNPISNNSDSNEKLCEDALLGYLNLYKYKNYYNKLIYLGSGAEFDKSNDIVQVSECEFSNKIPKNAYGIAKYCMNLLTQSSDNIYNLRIFGCFGPTDASFKFITHVINSCLDNKDIIINQDCFFDYIHVLDLYKAIEIAIENNLKYHDYNICSGNRYLLSDIAQVIKDKLNLKQEIIIKNKGLNKEYTGSNSRFQNEFPEFKCMELSEAIDLQIEYERRIRVEKKSS